MRGLRSPSPFGTSFSPLSSTLSSSRLASSLCSLSNSQLEAIIRISESLAKTVLSPVVLDHHVEEAIKLFKFSTMDAVQAGNVGMPREELMEEINKVEADIRRRLPIGWSTSYASLVREFVTQQGYVFFFLCSPSPEDDDD